MAMHCRDAVQQKRKYRGTYQWMAPEVLRGGGYSAETDMYSFAVE